jgi:hypothetical protein
VSATEQLTIDSQPSLADLWSGERDGARRAAAERAARASLRAQVERLERELSGLVARGFPHVASLPALAGGGAIGDGAGAGAIGGPRLLSLAELERARDRLVVSVRHAQLQVRQRAHHELRAHEQLERMRLEPGRYKFVRLRVSDLGERGCGVWQVRPRFGLIGMLAGWWQLKLSSGCPLPRAARLSRVAAAATRHGLTSAARPPSGGPPQNTSSPRIRAWRGRCGGSGGCGGSVGGVGGSPIPPLTGSTRARRPAHGRWRRACGAGDR